MPGSDADSNAAPANRAEAVTATESDQLCRLLTEHTRDFIRIHDLDGRSVYASRSVERLYGRVPETLFEFALPEDADTCRRWWVRVVAGHAGPERLRWRVRDAAGGFRWLETVATVVQFREKAHVLTVCRDVTGHVEADRALRESQRHLELVINTLPLGVIVLDRAGDIVLANPAFREIWGGVIVKGEERWARSEAYWRDSGKRIAPHQWASAHALSEGKTTVNEIIDAVDCHGRKRIIQNSAAPLRDASGTIVGAVVINEDVSERVRHEAALRDSERKLSEAQRVAHVGFWENDFAANRVTWSEETRRILGLPPEETARSPEGLRELIHPDDRPTFDDALTRALAGESGLHVEMRVLRDDGEVRHAHTFVDVIRDATGTPRRAFGAVQDITDRKRAEEALRESARKLNEAQRIAHLGHWEQDLDTGCVTASDETHRIFGLRPQEDLRTWQAWQEHVHPDDRSVRAAVIERAVREGTRYELEYRVLRPDGEIRIVRAQGEMAADDSSRPRRLFGILQDVTDRRRAEEARHAAEARLTHVVASSPAILLTLDVENGEIRGIEWMSENVEAILGYRADETLGPDWWWGNIDAEVRQRVVDQFLAEIFSQGHSAAEYRFRHKNGQFRWVRSEARLLRDEGGRAAEVIASLSDITERKRLEDQFQQAQKMEAVGHLAGGIAHDFNNLLTIIASYSDAMLFDLSPADPNHEMISEIRHAAERAAGLTRQLLAFSRRSVLEPKLVDVNAVVRDHEKMLRRLIGEDVELTTDLDATVETVRVDPGQLGQLIMNLAVNARDAMPTGGRLRIATNRLTLDEAAAARIADARPGRYVLVTVSDSGTGITPDVRAHLFEPFFTTKGPGRGTGLGLATVYGIVKQSGGFITVDSEQRRGSTFRIYFPAVASTAVTQTTPAARTTVARGTETILLVEDEDAVRSMIRVVLHNAGYTVLDASKGSDALRIAAEQSRPIDLLITDVVMPEMSGRELVEQLARQRPALKVLYLSGYTDDAIVRHGVLQAEVAFLQKPFTMTALTSKVREVLDQRVA